MTDSLHYIDSYFRGEFSTDELKRFEQRIIEDPAFAEELAFYVSSVHALREEVNENRKATFRKLYEQNKMRPVKQASGPWYYVAAAAAVVGLALSIFLFLPKNSPESLADRFIKDHFSSFGVMMNTEQDTLQTAVNLYNEGKLSDALKNFEDIIQKHPSQYKAKEYAGIVYLRNKQYDKALVYFRELAGDDRLYANPGKFYVALTLLKRNSPNDVKEAKILLRQVVEGGLQYDQAAKELLDQL